MSVGNPSREAVLAGMERDHGITRKQGEFVLQFVDNSITAAIIAARKQIMEQLILAAQDPELESAAKDALVAVAKGIQLSMMASDARRASRN